MSYSRSSRAYPVDMRNLVERVAATNQAHIVELPTTGKAGGLRSRFYAYKAAVKADATAPPQFMDKGEVEQLREFLRLFDSVEFTVSGTRLIVAPRDESATADALRNATPVAGDGLTAIVPSDRLKGVK